MQDWNSFNGVDPLKSQIQCDCNSYQGEKRGREKHKLVRVWNVRVAHVAHNGSVVML